MFVLWRTPAGSMPWVGAVIDSDKGVLVGDFVLDVPRNLHRSWHVNKEDWIRSAKAAHSLLCDVAGCTDLSEKSGLDYGCGSKLTKLFLENDLPIRRYVGIDTMKELIDFLQPSIHDERFSYHHVNLYNELYNREGIPLTDLDSLPLAGEQFDVICLFSVFTHLAPHDYKPLLKLLRPHASPDCRLVYSAFLDELSASGHGFMDKWGPLIVDKIEATPDSVSPDFCDFFPERSLEVAIYARSYALDLLEGTGWRIEEIRDPSPDIQHVFVCVPE